MKLSLITIAALSIFLSACGGSSLKADRAGSSASTYEIAESQPASAANTAAYSDNLEAQKTGGGGGGGTTRVAEDSVPLTQAEKAANVDRKIIKNADIALESEKPEAAQKRISAIAETVGGFVVESQQRNSDGRSANRDTVAMTIRVPAAKFGMVLDEIRKTPGRLVSENIKGQDVTEEFIDIEARLTAKKALETQFMEIMKRANSVDEALSVQRQLADVRTEIEKIEGRKRFLENQAGLSTIKVSIQTPAAIAASGAGFFSQLADSVNVGLESATGFVLGLVTILIAVLPFMIFIGLPGYLVIRYLWRNAKRRRTAEKIAEEELSNA